MNAIKFQLLENSKLPMESIHSLLKIEQRRMRERTLTEYDVEEVIRRAMARQRPEVIGWATDDGGAVPPSYKYGATTTGCLVLVNGRDLIVVVNRGHAVKVKNAHQRGSDMSIRHCIPGPGMPWSTHEHSELYTTILANALDWWTWAENLTQ